MISIRTLNHSDDSEYINFLDSLSHASRSVLGYHYPFYRDMLESIGLGHACYFGAWDGPTLIGVLPAFTKRSEIGTAYCSLPFFGPNAGVLCHRSSQEEEIHRSLINELLAHARDDDAISCSIYTPFLSPEPFNNYYRKYCRDAVSIEKFTQYNPLVGEPNWPSKKKWDIRKAYQQGIEVSSKHDDAHLDTVYEIYKTQCLSRGIPLKPRECLNHLTADCVLNKYSKIYYALHEGRVVGALLTVYSSVVASYYLPCCLPDYISKQVNTLLLDVAIREAHAMGISFWNWEASSDRQSGVYKFKRRWGATDELYNIYVTPFKPHSFYASVGAHAISEHFPNFYVYPFHLIDKLAN